LPATPAASSPHNPSNVPRSPPHKYEQDCGWVDRVVAGVRVRGYRELVHVFPPSGGEYTRWQVTAKSLEGCADTFGETREEAVAAMKKLMRDLINACVGARNPKTQLRTPMALKHTSISVHRRLGSDDEFLLIEDAMPPPDPVQSRAAGA